MNNSFIYCSYGLLDNYMVFDMCTKRDIGTYHIHVFLIYKVLIMQG